MDSIYANIPRQFNAADEMFNRNQAAKQMQSTAIISDEQTFSYHELHHNIKKLAALLENCSLERENRIAILLPNTPEFILFFWAALWLGAIPVPIAFDSSIRDIHSILQDCRAKVLVTCKGWQEKLNALPTTGIRHLLIYDHIDTLIKDIQHFSEIDTAANTTKDDIAFILYTSGQSKSVRGIAHYHATLPIASELYGQNILELTKEDRIYTLASFANSYGLGNAVIFSFYLGGSVIVGNHRSVQEHLETMCKYKASVLFTLPSNYGRLLELHEKQNYTLPSLRLCASSGEPLHKQLAKRWQETFGFGICSGFSTSEFFHVFISNKPGKELVGSIGKVIPGFEIKVIKDSGEEAKVGEVGNLWVKGETLMVAYWNRVLLSRKTIQDGGMFTGDQLIKQKDGSLTFVCRKDDFFKINGDWVSPYEVESIIKMHPCIEDVVIVPLENILNNTISSMACVILKKGYQPSSFLELDLKKLMSEHLSSEKIPSKIQYFDQFPFTAAGKIDRKLLTEKVNFSLVND